MTVAAGGTTVPKDRNAYEIGMKQALILLDVSEFIGAPPRLFQLPQTNA